MIMTVQKMVDTETEWHVRCICVGKKIIPIKYIFRKIVRRAKRTSYKSFLANKNKRMRKHTKVPKIFKRLPIGYKKLGAFLARDSSLNIFAVIYPLEQ